MLNNNPNRRVREIFTMALIGKSLMSAKILFWSDSHKIITEARFHSECYDFIGYIDLIQTKKL